jgi:hypothetical protein
VFLLKLVEYQILLVSAKYRGVLLKKQKPLNSLWSESYTETGDYRVWELFIFYITKSNFKLTHQLTLGRKDEVIIENALDLNPTLFSHKEWFDLNIKIAKECNIIQYLLNSEVLFVVNGSFFLEKFYLIEAA